MQVQGRLIVEGHEHLLFWPVDEVAMLLTEHQGRLTCVAASGEVAHRPGPLPDEPPWIRVSETSAVHPGHVKSSRGFVTGPGGWRVPGRLPARRAPQAPASDASDVVYARRVDGRVVRFTLRGEERGAATLRAEAAAHPALVPAGTSLVNPGRIRSIASDGRAYAIALDGGHELTITRPAGPRLATFLGLASLDRIAEGNPVHDAMRALGLRDWPAPLMDLSRDQIRSWVADDEKTLTANVVWETYRLRLRGQNPDYGRDQRGFYYLPVIPILNHAGFLSASPAWLGYDDPHFKLLERVLAELVGERALLEYRDLGFDEPTLETRRLGSHHPEVLLVLEKHSVEREAMEVARRFGVSVVVLGGQPTWILTEALARMLRPAVPGCVRIIAYVDFDPWGWVIIDSIVRQLARYDVTAEVAGYLVRPSRFTRREIASLAQAIPAPDAATRTKIRDWLRRSGGVHGKGMRLYADFLRDVPRLVQAFREESGLAETRT